MQTIAYQELLGLIDRLEPEIGELGQQITDVDDALAEAVRSLEATQAAHTVDDARDADLASALADLVVRSRNVLIASRRAALEWKRADEALSDQAEAADDTPPPVRTTSEVQ